MAVIIRVANPVVVLIIEAKKKLLYKQKQYRLFTNTNKKRIFSCDTLENNAFEHVTTCSGSPFTEVHFSFQCLVKEMCPSVLQLCRNFKC
jgi:hypothetical protein